MSFFGQNIRFLRTSQQMSQAMFAQLFGIKRAAVGAYEEERAEPKVELFVKIAEYFKISLEDLICKSLQDDGNATLKPANKGIPLVKTNEIAAYAEATASGAEYVYNQYMHIPGIGDKMTAFEFGRNILIVSEKGQEKGLFDSNSHGKTLLLKRSGIAMATGSLSDAEAIKSFDIHYIIKCYDKEDHAETMLEDISERLVRIEKRMGYPA